MARYSVKKHYINANFEQPGQKVAKVGLREWADAVSSTEGELPITSLDGLTIPSERQFCTVTSLSLRTGWKYV